MVSYRYGLVQNFGLAPKLYGVVRNINGVCTRFIDGEIIEFNVTNFTHTKIDAITPVGEGSCSMGLFVKAEDQYSCDTSTQ